MKRLAAMLAVAVFAGCADAPPAPESPPAEEPAPASPQGEMRDIEWHLWPSTETPGQDVKPLLSIWAEQVTGMGADTSELAFEGARAVVPAQEPGDLEIHFSAERGTYKEEERAVLRDGVTAQIDDMTIALEEISWDMTAGNEAGSGVATSNRPLTITSPTQQLRAASMRLDSASKTLELRDVTGEIVFNGETP